MSRRIIYILTAIFSALALCSCKSSEKTIPILSWAGIGHGNFEELLPICRECGIDWHLVHCKSVDEAREILKIAEKEGVGIIPGFPELRDSTEYAVRSIMNHKALVAYNIKDEPETWDIPWIADLSSKIKTIDPDHPSYINLYPDWAWGGDEYESHIELFASSTDVPFYSFDQYPVTEKDGEIKIRETWYRNLEVFSAMARRHERPFWAFALVTSHHLGAPSPPAFYPEPTLGHLRLQVYSDLLYGAQAIQYFTFSGIYDPATLEKAPLFDVVKTMNDEIKAYSKVFLDCKVKSVWHTGNIPYGTKRMDSMPHGLVTELDMSGVGAVVSLLEKGGRTFLAVQNKDCVNHARLDIAFKKKVQRIMPEKSEGFTSDTIDLEPGNIAVFKLD